MNKTEIRTELNRHYTKAFKRRNANFKLLSPDFKSEYKPKEDIDANIYKDLSALPSKDELNLIINLCRIKKRQVLMGSLTS